MNRERIGNWVEMCRRMVEPDGAASAWVELVGPDDSRIGRWPTSDENLVEAVCGMLELQRLEKPTGYHRFTLRSETSDGQQLSTLDQSVKGESSAAKTALNDARELQRTTGLAITNLETVIAAQNEQLERYRSQADELLSNNIQVVSALRDIMATTADMRHAEEEHQARMAGIATLVQQAEPLVAIVGGLLAEKLGEKMSDSKKTSTRAKRKTSSRVGEKE